MSAELENQRMLARLLGIGEDEAASRLQKTVVITFSLAATRLAKELKEQLERTINVELSGHTSDLEIVIDAEPVTDASKRIFVGGSLDRLLISNSTVQFESNTLDNLSGLHVVFAACYTAGVALKLVLDASDLGAAIDPFIIRYTDLGINRELAELSFVLSDTILAGAGAVGNGFLRALRHLSVSGELMVADPKMVSVGNLNRCLYFDDADVDAPKAETLCEKAKRDFERLTLTAYQKRSSEVVRLFGKIRRVIVAVDSRRVRRSIQNDLHLEVVDASTTEATEIVVHSHRQITANACLSCIYKHVEDESQRERDIAEGLGVSLSDVAEGIITRAVAERIVVTHPDLDPKLIDGIAYDSLFRQRCAEQALHTTTGGQVFAPFAFVSNLAGAFLALELVRAISTNFTGTNYFFLSPWHPTSLRARLTRPRVPECEFCSQPQSHEVLRELWLGDI